MSKLDAFLASVPDNVSTLEDTTYSPNAKGVDSEVNNFSMISTTNPSSPRAPNFSSSRFHNKQLALSTTSMTMIKDQPATPHPMIPTYNKIHEDICHSGNVRRLTQCFEQCLSAKYHESEEVNNNQKDLSPTNHECDSNQEESDPNSPEDDTKQGNTFQDSPLSQFVSMHPQAEIPKVEINESIVESKKDNATDKPHNKIQVQGITSNTLQYFMGLRIPTLAGVIPSAIDLNLICYQQSKLSNKDQNNYDNNRENELPEEPQIDSSLPNDFLSLNDPLAMINLFKKGGTLPIDCALRIIQQATKILAAQQNVIHIKAPYILVGDLHGQFQDLLNIFNVHNYPSVSNSYLFLGDYVDRGISSCEILFTLLSFKLQTPDNVHLLRGNHECRSLSTYYGFRNECLQKYGPIVYNRVIHCFESMPLAATIQTKRGKFLALHGGLSPAIELIEDINTKIDRFTEPSPNGPLCDILWADPAKEASKQEDCYVANQVRGCSYTFNERACRIFLDRNNLLALIRAHELEDFGFKEHFLPSRQTSSASGSLDPCLPAVITVFSAPQYCNINSNMGATLKLTYSSSGGKIMQYQQHTRSQTPENHFKGASEGERLKEYFLQHIPFFPVDFHELVRSCFKLRDTKISHSHGIILQKLSTNNVSLSASNHNEKNVFGASVSTQSITSDGVKYPNNVQCLANQNSTAEHCSHSSNALPNRRLPFRWKFWKLIVKLYKKSPLKSSNRNKSQSKNWFWLSFYGNQLPTTPEINNAVHAARRKSSLDWSIPQSPRVRRVTQNIASPPVQSATSTLVDTTKIAKYATNNRDEIEEADPSSADYNIEAKEAFTENEWIGLKLLFSLLDANCLGYISASNFITLLAEQDIDAYATEDELKLIMLLMDSDQDKIISITDFLAFAYRSKVSYYNPI